MESNNCIHTCILIHEAQAGNQAAFKQLVYVHDQAVLRLAYRITGSQSDALDIYQEAFLKAYKKLAGFRFDCSFSTWIYRIVADVCLDELRKNRNRRESKTIEVNNASEEFELPRQISDDRLTNSPEQRLLSRELSTSIRRGLQSLTPLERMVFELMHFQGLKLQTVSEILNTTEGSVKLCFLSHAEAAIPVG
jgi:RNA polymerase sigma-70 factor (ECF subfamily)